jgi:myosin-crossreactive antigen
MKPKAYLVGGGIGSLAAAAFMIRDAGVPGENISILEAASLMGGSLDGAGNPATGYSMRGGRMLTTDNYECTWDLYKSIPSLDEPGPEVLRVISLHRGTTHRVAHASRLFILLMGASAYRHRASVATKIQLGSVHGEWDD